MNCVDSEAAGSDRSCCVYTFVNGIKCRWTRKAKENSPLKRRRWITLVVRYNLPLQYMQINSHMLFIAIHPSIHPSVSFLKMIFSIFLKDGDKQDQGASSSKPKSKVKSVDLPILANTTRQLDQHVLNNFVDYEVSHNPLSVCLSSLENVEWCDSFSSPLFPPSAFLILISNWSSIFCTLGWIHFVLYVLTISVSL